MTCLSECARGCVRRRGSGSRNYELEGRGGKVVERGRASIDELHIGMAFTEGCAERERMEKSKGGGDR